MTVRWTPTALGDLESLHACISDDNPGAAAATVDQIVAGIEMLARYPHIGRVGRVPGTRELVIPPYIVAYRVRRAAIEVAAILHGVRRWPDSF
jgi:toxin ParE1/3/4